ncbi:phosphoglycerate dehydrogenase [Streptomyces sp. SCUT-3]|uniref:2-hydroxyacid dehydrogenase n=1 Tax=Streptomyces sp. SCUT-3 TaxID=2684469 RepID=UPI0015FE31F5|nr:NAD(P)-dependent oxidoreductase [Streptomyces sp. SCUT-3]QMV23694.1 phosphoglycerate dehydrogenase [Streptomyces sp. SCUT-3]
MSRTSVLAVVPPQVGGREAGAGVALLLADRADVTVVESTDEDPGALAAAQVIVTALAPVRAGHIDAAPRLEMVQCVGHGHDHVDLAHAHRRGVTVCTIASSGAEGNTVAEHAFALILACAKKVVPAHTALARGEWALDRLRPELTELAGKTLGIVGLGHIGRDVARKAAAFDMTVLYASPRRAPAEVEQRTGARWTELDDLLRTADVVTLHAPLDDSTRNLLDARRLALLKPTAILVNTARGPLVDSDALADALENGRIAAAGLDVFDPEPPEAGSRLLSAPNTVLTPHAGAVTRETLVRIALAAVENVGRHLDGTGPRDAVRPR